MTTTAHTRYCAFALHPGTCFNAQIMHQFHPGHPDQDVHGRRGPRFGHGGLSPLFKKIITGDKDAPDDDVETEAIDFGDEKTVDWSRFDENTGEYTFEIQAPPRALSEEDEEEGEEEESGVAQLRLTPTDFDRVLSGIGAAMLREEMLRNPIDASDPKAQFLAAMIESASFGGIDEWTAGGYDQEVGWFHNPTTGMWSINAKDDDGDSVGFEVTDEQLRKLHATMTLHQIEMRRGRGRQTAATDTFERGGHLVTVTRGRSGKFARGGAIDAALASGAVDALSEFKRPALLKALRDRGIKAPRGAPDDDLRALLGPAQTTPAPQAPRPQNPTTQAFTRLYAWHGNGDRIINPAEDRVIRAMRERGFTAQETRGRTVDWVGPDGTNITTTSRPDTDPPRIEFDETAAGERPLTARQALDRVKGTTRPTKRAPATTAKTRGPKLLQHEVDGIGEQIREAMAAPMPSDRERLKAELSRLTLDQMAQVADFNDLTMPGGAGVRTKADKVNRLVENAVGARLNSNALQHGGWTDTPGGPDPRIADIRARMAAADDAGDRGAYQRARQDLINMQRGVQMEPAPFRPTRAQAEAAGQVAPVGAPAKPSSRSTKASRRAAQVREDHAAIMGWRGDNSGAPTPMRPTRDMHAARAFAEQAIEIEELAAAGASERAFVHRLRGRMKRLKLHPVDNSDGTVSYTWKRAGTDVPLQPGQGSDDPDLASAQQLAKIAIAAETMARAGASPDQIVEHVRGEQSAQGLTPTARAGEIVRFDPHVHRSTSGSAPAGTPMRVSAPGYRWTPPEDAGDDVKPALVERALVYHADALVEPDPETAARVRQAGIDDARARAEVIAELVETTLNGADPAVKARLVEATATRGGIGIDPEVVGLVHAIRGNDLDGMIRGRRLLEERYGLDPIGVQREQNFDPKLHQMIDGAPKARAGQRVDLVRPGFYATVNGERVLISRAIVEPERPEEDDPDFADVPDVAPDPAPALTGRVMSSRPLIENTWGGRMSEIHFHDDGEIGQAIRRMGADARLEVEGDALANVLGRAATDLVNGRITAVQQVDRLKEIAAKLPEGNGKVILGQAIRELDFPVHSLMPLPSETPPAMRPVLETLRAKLAQIPLANRPVSHRDGATEMDKINDLVSDFVGGRARGGMGFIDKVRQLAWNQRHESQEGKFDIDRAVLAAVAELEQLIRDPAGRPAFYPQRPEQA